MVLSGPVHSIHENPVRWARGDMLSCACGVTGDYYIPKDAKVSPEVLDLLSKIFQVDPMKRITLSEIWDHAWVRKGLPPNLDVDGFNAEYVRLTGVSAFLLKSIVSATRLLAPFLYWCAPCRLDACGGNDPCRASPICAVLGVKWKCGANT
jgi:serine/threonine protein kinase